MDQATAFANTVLNLKVIKDPEMLRNISELVKSQISKHAPKKTFRINKHPATGGRSKFYNKFHKRLPNSKKGCINGKTCGRIGDPDNPCPYNHNIPFKTTKECNFGLRCHKSSCPFRHPVGWDPSGGSRDDDSSDDSSSDEFVINPLYTEDIDDNGGGGGAKSPPTVPKSAPIGDWGDD